MNILSLITRPGATALEFNVVWANGLQRQGTIRVRLAQEVADPVVAAELGALHHLLVRRAIFGDDRAGRAVNRDGLDDQDADPDAGRVQLRVSSGQIRKLMLGTSKKTHLVPFAFFLSSRFYGANVAVSNDTSWIKPRAAANVEEITVSGALDDWQDVPGVGLSVLSQHALEQLRIRGNGLDPAGAWQQLRRIVKSCTQEVNAGDAKRQRDIARHGYPGRCLYSPQSGWNIVITAPNGSDRSMPVIATVFFDKRGAHEVRPLAMCAS